MKRFSTVQAAPAPRDILREKQTEIERLTAEADNAVDMVTRTINRLELINQQIDDGVAELDEYASSIRATREQMQKQRGHNAAIISNFTKLLSVGDADGAPEKEGA